MDKTIRIWDLNALTCIRKIKCYKPARCFVFLSTGELVSGYQDNRIDIWDLNKYCHLKSFRDHNLRMVNSMVESNRWSNFLKFLIHSWNKFTFFKRVDQDLSKILMLKISESLTFSDIYNKCYNRAKLIKSTLSINYDPCTFRAIFSDYETESLYDMLKKRW